MPQFSFLPAWVPKYELDWQLDFLLKRMKGPGVEVANHFRLALDR